MVRVKNRYMCLDIKLWQDDQKRPDSFPLSARSINGFLREQIKTNFGDLGAGLVLSGMQVKYFSPKTNVAILKVPRDHCRMVATTLSLATQIHKRPCSVYAVHISGTIKKCQRAAIRMDRERIIAWYKSQQAPNKDASLITSDHTLRTLLKESESQISALEL